MKLLETVTSKVVGGIVAVGVIAAAVGWWQMEPATRHWLLASTGKIIAWLGVVALWPWVSFALIGWVGRMSSNAAGAVLVGAYTLAELLLLLWLFGWSLPGPTAWVFFGVGGLLASAYNLFSCDWIAEKL